MYDLQYGLRRGWVNHYPPVPRYPLSAGQLEPYSPLSKLCSAVSPYQWATALFQFKTEHWRRERGLAVNLAGNARAITRRTLAGRRVRPFVTFSVRRAAHHAVAINRILEITRNDFTGLRIVNP